MEDRSGNLIELYCFRKEEAINWELHREVIQGVLLERGGDDVMAEGEVG